MIKLMSRLARALKSIVGKRNEPFRNPLIVLLTLIALGLVFVFFFSCAPTTFIQETSAPNLSPVSSPFPTSTNKGKPVSVPPKDTHTVPMPPSTPTDVRGESSFELIKAAYQRGEINYDEQLVYLVYSVFAPKLLPQKYRSDVPCKDATPIILEVKRNWDRLSPDARDKIAPYIHPLRE